MHKIQFVSLTFSLPALATLLFAGCQPQPKTATLAAPPEAAGAVVVAVPTVIPKASVEAASASAIHIKAGGSAEFRDSSGNRWQPDQGFDGGDTIDRSDLEIANTTDPAIYRAERYGMNSFTQKLPNGKYIVKLHFCETFEGIEGTGQRVFSFNVEGHEFKDFDVWAKAGGPRRAYVETVPVEIKDGKLDITFTSNIENPEINGIEIIPQS